MEECCAPPNRRGEWAAAVERRQADRARYRCVPATLTLAGGG